MLQGINNTQLKHAQHNELTIRQSTKGTQYIDAEHNNTQNNG